MRTPILTTFGAIAATVAIAACGSSGSTTSSSGAPAVTTTSSTAASTPTAAASGSTTAASSVVSISANSSGALMFNTNAVTAKAGKVTIHFTNDAPEAHDLSIQQGTGASGAVLAATGAFMGATKTLTLTLKPGSYTYFCNVPGHRAAGMHGTLTVVAS